MLSCTSCLVQTDICWQFTLSYSFFNAHYMFTFSWATGAQSTTSHSFPLKNQFNTSSHLCLVSLVAFLIIFCIHFSCSPYVLCDQTILPSLIWWNVPIIQLPIILDSVRCISYISSIYKCFHPPLTSCLFS
jgi:hypothetical protein